MKLRLTIFGFEMFSLELVKTVSLALELEDGTVLGGEGHNFERDPAPLSPDDRYAPDWEWKGFGFTG